MPVPAFSTNVFILSKPNAFPLALTPRKSIKSGHIKCTAAPERAKITKKSLPSQFYRVLPANLPVSERPPPPPRHNSIPYVGFFIEYFLGLFNGSFKTLNKKYGPICYSNFFLAPMFYLDSYGATCEILKDHVSFATKDGFPGLGDLFGDDVLNVTDGKEHEVARSVIGPAFSPALFQYYLKNVVKRTNETWKRVEETVENDGSILFDPMFREHYLGITIEMTTGVKVNSERSSLMRTLFSDFTKSFEALPFMPAYKKALAARDEIRGILREIILENISSRRDIIDKLREYGDDVVKLGIKDISRGNVDVLLISIANSSISTDGNGPLDEELIGTLSRNMLLLWIAGYITSAVTSSCGIFELGIRDELLSRLVKEQDEIISGVGEREVTYEQIQWQMPLLDAYLMEILRVHPPLNLLWRKTTRDVEILGTYVPGGSRMYLDIAGPHSDENLYADADQIVPERWLERPKPPAILTFGAPGTPHYCIGAGFAKVMMKTTFATLLREFEFQLDPNQSRKYKALPDKAPESGVVVNKFVRRRQSSDDGE